jgi:hypothetical protein
MTTINLPIGYDDFSKIINKKLTFVDKSLLIKDFIDDESTEVSLITRPRRFGKTTNLSMLHHYFAAEVRGLPTKDLFTGLKIMQQGPEYLQHQGKYPVIALSFKDVKDGSFQSAYANLCNLLSRTYQEHLLLLDSPKVTSRQKMDFEAIYKRKADESQVSASLLDLCDCLYRHYGEKAILLLDEYDTPIQSGYAHGYYDKIVELIRHLFGAVLKSNPYLHRAMLTGILRISKESLFSGLNNLKVYSVLNPKYSEYFGFTEAEVNHLFTQVNFARNLEQIKGWYNGYRIADTVIYNPWSIVNCIHEQGLVKPYWVNTSDNLLIKNLLVQANTKFKHEFELLLEDQVVEKYIDENFVFPEIKTSQAAVWSLLLMTGYLKVVAVQETFQGTLCQLKIPNLEIRYLYRKIIEQWLSNGKGVEWYNEFLHNLLTGNVEEFKSSLHDVMLQTASVHDLAREPEAFYQGLMIGLTASLDKREYEIKSNRESGIGRYDIVIIPKDVDKLAIILELKSVKRPKNEESLTLLLQQEAQAALLQIDKNGYDAELKQRGINHALKMGLAFSGKQFHIATRSHRSH